MSHLSMKIRPPKAAMTATGSRAEKSFSMTEHKDTSFTSFSIKAETLNRLTLFQRSRRGLTALKTIYLTLSVAGFYPLRLLGGTLAD
jgi:hypothetical protein